MKSEKGRVVARDPPQAMTVAEWEAWREAETERMLAVVRDQIGAMLTKDHQTEPPEDSTQSRNRSMPCQSAELSTFVEYRLGNPR